jgi:Holliday junction resolvase RusA-like endonuclease
MTISPEIEVEQLIVFTVPTWPVSTNHYTKDCFYTGRDGYGHRGKKLTPEAKAFESAVALFARSRTVAPLSQTDRRKAKYRVEIHLYYGYRTRLDPDNAFKQCLDSLVKCGVIHSDTHVFPQVVPHKNERDNPENPRVQFIVERLEP